ncbi:MAG: GPW/gp25 family protein [Eubacteriales bacterium]
MAYPDTGKEFLGVGWAFPLAVDSATGRMQEVSSEADIRQAIPIILGTALGQRVMQPEFGSTLSNFVFDNPSYTARVQLENEVVATLHRWEPRITQIEVTVTDGGEGCLLLNIAYVVRATNNPYNLVYPFYLQEGLEL